MNHNNEIFSAVHYKHFKSLFLFESGLPIWLLVRSQRFYWMTVKRVFFFCAVRLQSSKETVTIKKNFTVLEKIDRCDENVSVGNKIQL